MCIDDQSMEGVRARTIKRLAVLSIRGNFLSKDKRGKKWRKKIDLKSGRMSYSTRKMFFAACCLKISNQPRKSPRIYLMGFVLFNFRPTRGEKSRRDYFLFALLQPSNCPHCGNKSISTDRRPRWAALQARSSPRR